MVSTFAKSVLRSRGHAFPWFFLMEIGYTVLTAGNGEEAVEIFRRHKETISLAVLDVVMPRMSGKAAEIGISFFPGMVGRRGEALGTYPAVVFRGLDQPSRYATPPAAASGSFSPSVYPPWAEPVTFGRDDRLPRRSNILRLAGRFSQGGVGGLPIARGHRQPRA